MAATPVTLNRVEHKTAMLKPAAVACDPANGNSVANAGHTMLELTNGGGSPATVEVAFVASVDGETPDPLSYSLAASETRVVGGWPVSAYGSLVTFTASDAAVTCTAYEV